MNLNLRKAVLLAGSFLVIPALLHAQRIVIASSYPGADLGAQIMAADAALGATPGTIRVTQPGKVSSHIILGAGHGLDLQAPTTWLIPADLSGGNAITCGGEKAMLTATLPHQNALFNAKAVQQVSVDNCWATATNPGGGSYYVFFGIKVNDVKVIHGHFQNISGVHVQVGGERGQPMTEANLSTNIVFADNFVEYTVKLPNTQFIGAQLVGVDHAEIRHNYLRGLTHGVMYWGGDSNKEIRDRYTPRWARNIVIEDNDCAYTTIGSCYWGSMGTNIQYLRNQASHCGDACLDIEGDVNDLIEGNTVIDGNLGILMRNWNLEYRNNTIESTNAGEPLVHLSNNTGSGDQNGDLYMHDNVFRCTDPRTVCRIEYQAVQNFRFIHNTVTNGVMHPYDPHQWGTVVQDNTFTFDHTNSAPFAAIDASWQVRGYSSRVINNVILSNAPQPAGSQCIRVAWADSGAPSEDFIQGNTCGGSHPFPVDLEMVSNGARTSSVTFHVASNHFANNKIVRENNTHTATFDIHN